MRLLAHYSNDLSYIYPFREGIGRTQRVFWSLVAADGGRRIDWPSISGNEMDRAAERARITGDDEPLETMFESRISYMNPSLTSHVQLLSDLSSGMRHLDYDDYERYGSGSYYSR